MSICLRIILLPMTFLLTEKCLISNVWPMAQHGQTSGGFNVSFSSGGVMVMPLQPGSIFGLQDPFNDNGALTIHQVVSVNGPYFYAQQLLNKDKLSPRLFKVSAWPQ